MSDKLTARIRSVMRSPKARDTAYRIADSLPPRARQTFLRAASRARDLVVDTKGTTARSAMPMRTQRTGLVPGMKTPPKRFRVSPQPAPISDQWPDAPEVDVPGQPIRSVYRSSGKAPVFDVELFEQLNEEYRSKPIVPEPQGKDTASRAERAKRRLTSIHDAIGLAGLRTLEFGCGAGYEVWYMGNHLKADAHGIDVVHRKAWDALQGPNVHYECEDITQKNPFAENFFDRIISFSVFEHVQHPHAALTELHKILKPGGLAWISANLHRSAVASHLYRDIFFPWPHLLFSDDVFKEFYERQGKRPHGPSWVNTLTWEQYENHFHRLGFTIKMLRFSEREFDEEFYKRFEDVLGKYPKWDLTKDFFNVIVEKPA